MKARKTLREQVVDAVRRATRKDGGPVTLGRILAEVRPEEGYVEDYRRVAVEVTRVAAYTPHGDPLREVAS